MNVSSILVCVFGFLLFNFIIMAHEWGHFITAIKFGVKVKEFAIGMGPRILKFQKGETIYSLRLFPIGGFCAMEGEEDSDDSGDDKEKDVIDPNRSLRSKAPWQKAIIMVAGIFMNFIVGLLLSIILTCCDTSLHTNVVKTISGDLVRLSSVSEFEKLKEGDKIVSINGYKLVVNRDLKHAIRLSNNGLCELDVIRNGQLVKINTDITEDKQDGSQVINVTFEPMEKNLLSVTSYSLADVLSIMRNSIDSILKLFTGKLSIKKLSGPIGVASSIGDAAFDKSKNIGAALFSVTNMMMLISLGLAVFNAVPFPALDGGRVVLLIPEVITGKPVNPKVEMIINAIGLIAVLVLTGIIAYNDIISWGSK